MTFARSVPNQTLNVGKWPTAVAHRRRSLAALYASLAPYSSSFFGSLHQNVERPRTFGAEIARKERSGSLPRQCRWNHARDAECGNCGSRVGQSQQMGRADRVFSGAPSGRKQIRIVPRLRHMAAGNLCDSQAPGDDVSELKVEFGPGYRLYFTRRGRVIFAIPTAGDRASPN